MKLYLVWELNVAGAYWCTLCKQTLKWTFNDTLQNKKRLFFFFPPETRVYLVNSFW